MFPGQLFQSSWGLFGSKCLCGESVMPPWGFSLRLAIAVSGQHFCFSRRLLLVASRIEESVLPSTLLALPPSWAVMQTSVSLPVWCTTPCLATLFAALQVAHSLGTAFVCVGVAITQSPPPGLQPLSLLFPESEISSVINLFIKTSFCLFVVQVKCIKKNKNYNQNSHHKPC